MSGFSQSSVSSQSFRVTIRKWVLEEDVALVACMVDLHNVGTFNADTRFKAGYLNELEKMLEKVLPHAMLKAKPNLESRIRTLKRLLQIRMKKNDFHGCKSGVSLDDMDLSATQPQPPRNQAENIRTVGLEINRSIASEVLIQQKSEMAIQESVLNLYPTLCKVECLTVNERYRTLSKIPDHPKQILIFFSLPSSV
ncbi:hypothetical protein Gotri_015998 [Gossypium trilobum]|uniref:Uncharacterized protein n=1 Tax=Gossypium trilobum TaxID=34281 RepID=A0A7J9E1Y7_9ROSI|nr:hypothetical protein [Gossypium trilobum]